MANPALQRKPRRSRKASVRRSAADDPDSDLRTGSLGAGGLVGALARDRDRRRGPPAAQVARPHGGRTRRRGRHLRRHAVEDRERRDLAVARDARCARQGAQRADQPAVRRKRGAARLLVRQGRQRRAHRAARHQGRPPVRPARPFARRRDRRRALSHHAARRTRSPTPTSAMPASSSSTCCPARCAIATPTAAI